MPLPIRFRILWSQYTSRKTIFGWIVFFYNAISILISFIILKEADHIFKATFEQVPKHEIKQTWISPYFGRGATIYSKFFVKTFLIFRICGLITSIPVIGALVKNKRNLLVPYMIYDFLALSLWVILWTSTLLDFFDHLTQFKSNYKNVYWIHIHLPELAIKTIGFGECSNMYF